MANTDSVSTKEPPKKTGVTLFGIPIIQTKCQRDSFLYGIGGGIVSGLVAFLFTSQPKKSTHIAVGGYAVITLCYAFNCCYDDYKMRKEIRIIQRTIRQAQLGHNKTENPPEMENI